MVEIILKNEVVVLGTNFYLDPDAELVQVTSTKIEGHTIIIPLNNIQMVNVYEDVKETH